MRLSYYAQLV